MKLYRFVRAHPKQIGHFDVNLVSKDLQEVAKNMSEDDILKMLGSPQHIPDLIALIYSINRKNFDGALLRWIKGQLLGKRLSPNTEKVLLQTGKKVDELANDVYVELSKSFLQDLALDGSRSEQFRYTQDATATAQLINTTQPNKDGINIPLCPYCSECGVSAPLFVVDKSTLTSEANLQNDRHNFVQPVEGIKLPEPSPPGTTITSETSQGTTFVVSNGTIAFQVLLTPEVSKWITADSPLRNLEIENNQPVLHCTFTLKPNVVGAALRARGPQKVVMNLIGKLNKALGRFTKQDYSLLEKVKFLQEKQPLTMEEARELEKLQKQIYTRQKKLVNEISLDTTVSSKGSSQDKGKSLHDTVSTTTEDTLEQLLSSLQTHLDEEDLDELVKISKMDSTKKAFMQALAVYQTEIHNKVSPKQRLQQPNYVKALRSSAYIQTCNTCKGSQTQPSTACQYAKKLHNHLYAMYTNSMHQEPQDRILDFNANLRALDNYEHRHLEASNVVPRVITLLEEVEVSEDTTEDEETTILSFNSFKEYIQSKLTPEQKQAFLGQDLSEFSPQDITNSVMDLDQLIATVVSKDLTKELQDFLHQLS